MSNRLRAKPFVADMLWIALIGLAIQAIWALRLTQPSYFDAYYYATNGQRLAGGYGFTEQIIWQFLDNPVGLPTPSHTYWMPLPSLLAALGYLAADSFRAAQFPFWLLAGLLPLLSYRLSWAMSGTRWQAWTAALLTASSGFYSTFWSQPSTFAPFAWLGAGALWLLGVTLTSNERRYWFWVGVLAGLAHLTRADGVLLLLLGGWLWLLSWRGGKRPFLSPLLMLAGYLLIMGGWFWHNWLVVGRLLPTAGTQTIFLTAYEDLFAYGRAMTLADYMAWGWGNIVRSKLVALGEAGLLLTAVLSLIFLTPFVVWGCWAQRKRPLPRPFFWYATTLVLVMSLLFTFPSGRGSLLHSSVSLWPWFMVLAADGIGHAVAWRNRRWPPVRPEQTKRAYGFIFVVVAFVATLAVGWLRVPETGHVALFTQIAAELPKTAVVMVGNAPGFYYHTGLPAITVPNEPPHVLVQAARQYGVTHLILDRDTPSLLRAFYEGEAAASNHIVLLKTVDNVNLYVLQGDVPDE